MNGSTPEHLRFLRSAYRLVRAVTDAGAYDAEAGDWLGGVGAAPISLFFAACVGDGVVGSELGVDAFASLDEEDGDSNAVTVCSTAGFCSPGGPALWQMLAKLHGVRAGGQVEVRVGPAAVWAVGGENWCLFNLHGSSPLVIESEGPAHQPAHDYAAAEVEILDQNGEDFSVGEHGGHGALISAAGGQMQAGFIIGGLLL